MDNREVRHLRVKFLNLRNQKRIIKQMSTYDDSKTFHDNCVDFLKEMEKQGRLEELDKLIDEE